MEREIKELFYGWSEEILREKRFKHIRNSEEWANFVRDNPDKWKKIHTEFINAIFDKHEQFKERLLRSPGGKEKLKKLYGRNKEKTVS